jgi:hypothetical protein
VLTSWIKGNPLVAIINRSVLEPVIHKTGREGGEDLAKGFHLLSYKFFASAKLELL